MNGIDSPYRGQSIALATKHGKEEIIAPPFRDHLLCGLIVPDLDTDTLGTFTGETERPGNMLEAAIMKARMGMEATGRPFGLSSEGSFGPHPVIPFIPCDRELMLFIDDDRHFMLHEVILCEDTNYRQTSVDTLEGAMAFLRRCRFPSHAAIVRPHDWEDKRIVFKGLVAESAVEAAFKASKQASKDGKVWVETDMRANFNPSRRRVIGDLAARLATRLATPCPACSTPGWGGISVEKGLLCEWCESPTSMVKTETFGCVACDYREIQPRSDKMLRAPQANCGNCNP